MVNLSTVPFIGQRMELLTCIHKCTYVELFVGIMNNKIIAITLSNDRLHHITTLPTTNQHCKIFCMSCRHTLSKFGKCLEISYKPCITNEICETNMALAGTACCVAADRHKYYFH